MKQDNEIQKNPELSIIVPVYNIEKYLNKCIDSLLQQTLKTIEIILIDDGSTDNSGSICDEYAKRDNRIVVIHQENKGASYARNVGLKMAKGEWVTFVDSDDWVEENLYEIAMKELKENQPDIFIFNYYNNYPKKQLENKKAPLMDFIVKNNEVRKLQLCILDTRAIDMIRVYDIAIRKNTSFQYESKEWLGMSYLWNKIFKKKLIENNKLEISLQEFKNVIYEDGLFCYKYFKSVTKAQYCSKCLYHHRRIENSIMKSYNPQIIKISNKVLEEYFKEEKEQEKTELQAIYIRAIRNFRDICFLYLFNRKNKNTNKQKSTEFKKLVKQTLYQETLKNIDTSRLGKSYKYYCKYAKSANYILLKLFNIFEKKLQNLIALKNKTKFYK